MYKKVEFHLSNGGVLVSILSEEEHTTIRKSWREACMLGGDWPGFITIPSSSVRIELNVSMKTVIAITAKEDLRA
jgi:hypothetical protein